MRLLKLFAAVGLASLLGACAHPIVINPDVTKLEKPTGAPIKKTVGFYIAPEDKAKEVTTPGGGGDKVTYLPYRDLEAGLFSVLSNVFEKAVVLSSPSDADAIAKSGVSMIIRPTIITDSSSSSALTWPPTSFTVQLDCKVTDAKGAEILVKSVKATGAASFSEFKTDFGLAGRRASQDALIKLQRELLDAPELRR